MTGEKAVRAVSTELSIANLIGNARGEIYSQSFGNKHLTKACGDMLIAVDILTGCADTSGSIGKEEKQAAVDALKKAMKQTVKSIADCPRCESVAGMIEEAIERVQEL